MANDAPAPETPAAPAAEPKATPKWLIPAVLVAALGAGAAIGILVVGPKVAPKPVVADSAAAAAVTHEAESAKEGEARIFRVDNLIVNPAGSAGTRFLMVSVAFETPNEEADKLLRDQEVQVRDAVTATLERQTLEMLTRPGARDSLKVQLGDVVTPLLHGRALVRVYLPQLVIQ